MQVAVSDATARASCPRADCSNATGVPFDVPHLLEHGSVQTTCDVCNVPMIVLLAGTTRAQECNLPTAVEVTVEIDHGRTNGRGH